jgi:hypothetical protein
LDLGCRTFITGAKARFAAGAFHKTNAASEKNNTIVKLAVILV